MIVDVERITAIIKWYATITAHGIIAMVMILEIHGHILRPVHHVLRKGISIGEDIALSVSSGMSFLCRMDH